MVTPKIKAFIKNREQEEYDAIRLRKQISITELELDIFEHYCYNTGNDKPTNEIFNISNDDLKNHVLSAMQCVLKRSVKELTPYNIELAFFRANNIGIFKHQKLYISYD